MITRRELRTWAYLLPVIPRGPSTEHAHRHAALKTNEVQPSVAIEVDDTQHFDRWRRRKRLEYRTLVGEPDVCGRGAGRRQVEGTIVVEIREKKTWRRTNTGLKRIPYSNSLCLPAFVNPRRT